jgi:hypothetical protein
MCAKQTVSTVALAKGNTQHEQLCASPLTECKLRLISDLRQTTAAGSTRCRPTGCCSPTQQPSQANETFAPLRTLSGRSAVPRVQIPASSPYGTSHTGSFTGARQHIMAPRPTPACAARASRKRSRNRRTLDVHHARTFRRFGCASQKQLQQQPRCGRRRLSYAGASATRRHARTCTALRPCVGRELSQDVRTYRHR